MKNKLILTIILFITLLTNTLSSEYYADLLIEVNENGESTFSGITNYELLQPKTSQEYTTKLGNKWTFQLDINETFSEYVYEIKFPIGTEIQNIQTNSSYRITTKDGRITLIGTGNETQLKIKTDYLIKKSELDPTIIIFTIIIFAIIVAGYLLLKNNKSKKENQTTKNLIYDKDALTERQLKIIELLERNNGKITQAQLQKTLNYPKAALSRNLQTLEKKEIIEKERKGMTMLVKIKTKKTL